MSEAELPLWDCGCRHRTRREAVECKRAKAEKPIEALAVIGCEPQVPPHADAGAFC